MPSLKQAEEKEKMQEAVAKRKKNMGPSRARTEEKCGIFEGYWLRRCR